MATDLAFARFELRLVIGLTTLRPRSAAVVVTCNQEQFVSNFFDRLDAGLENFGNSWLKANGK